MPRYRHIETGDEVLSATQLTRYEHSDAWETVTDTPAEDGPPPKSATRAEWEEYAARQGVDGTAFATKEELQAALENGGGDG